MSSQGTAVAGWYPDPKNTDLEWWWDGSQYTQSRSRQAQVAPPPAPTAPAGAQAYPVAAGPAPAPSLGFRTRIVSGILTEIGDGRTNSLVHGQQVDQFGNVIQSGVALQSSDDIKYIEVSTAAGPVVIRKVTVASGLAGKFRTSLGQEVTLYLVKNGLGREILAGIGVGGRAFRTAFGAWPVVGLFGLAFAIAAIVLLFALGSSAGFVFGLIVFVILGYFGYFFMSMAYAGFICGRVPKAIKI